MSRLGSYRSKILSVGIGAMSWLLLATAGHASCEIFSVPQRFNTQTVSTGGNSTGLESNETDGARAEVPTEKPVIVIGAQSGRPYRVMVVSADFDTLTALRTCVLDALITQSRFGDYILAGSFELRSDAELISRLLREAGYPARVIFKR